MLHGACVKTSMSLCFRHHGCWIEASDPAAVAAVLLATDHNQRGKIHKEGEKRQASCLSIVSKYTVFSNCILTDHVVITVSVLPRLRTRKGKNILLHMIFKSASHKTLRLNQLSTTKSVKNPKIPHIYHISKSTTNSPAPFSV